MKQLRFFGNSDDTFGEYRVFNDDYDNCASGDPIRYLVTGNGGDDRFYVFGQYCPDPASGWMVGVAPTNQPRDEVNGDVSGVPDWPMRIEQPEPDYSPVLIIDAPDDVAINCFERTDQ